MTNERPPIEGVKSEHRALAMLRFLQREPACRSNERILSARLEELGVEAPPSDIRAALEMLERSGLVKTAAVDELIVVSLTARGEEAALGKTVVEGVLRPGPEESY